MTPRASQRASPRASAVGAERNAIDAALIAPAVWFALFVGVSIVPGISQAALLMLAPPCIAFAPEPLGRNA